MTALALRARQTVAGRPLVSLAVLALVVIALAVALFAARDRADATTVSVRITPTKAAQLIDATSGAKANDFQAIGDRAKVINAALPFVGGPLHAARPFAVSGSDVDQRRA
jgi:hypothetical protein